MKTIINRRKESDISTRDKGGATLPTLLGVGSRTVAIALAMGALSLLASTADAEVKLTTLENTGAGGLTIGGSTAPGAVSGSGFAFTVDGQDYQLDAIRAALSTSNAGDWILTAALYEASSSTGVPIGSALTSFTYGSIGSGVTYVEFSPDFSVTLQANKSYVFTLLAVDTALEPPGSGSGWLWMTSSAANGYGPVGTEWAPLTVIPTTADGGDNWSGGFAGNYHKLEISVTAVPEPSTWALIAGSLAVGAYLRRGKRIQG